MRAVPSKLLLLALPVSVSSLTEFVAATSGRSAGLAYEILQSGFQLDIPRMFAALALITVDEEVTRTVPVVSVPPARSFAKI
jgi:ABC-type nitrate/sulfonate/bicarbonate transport system permease component